MLFTLLLILTAVWILSSGIGGWRRVAHEASAPHAGEADSDDPAARWPKVSVVSYALRDEESLSEYLDMLLTQDYPDMEVVLVCDASAEATAMIAERFGSVSNLHVTFIPPGSHNLSRRKLAQTIGIKAAGGEVVILTSTSVTPVSAGWIREMAAPFAADARTAAALGFMRLPAGDLDGRTRWYRQFDYVVDSASWIGAALTGKAYRGDGCNLALRRDLFFTNKGYASTISLMDGDDDIFLRELSRYGKIAMCMTPDSAVEACRGARTDSFYIDLKDRRLFTRRYLPAGPFLRQGLLSASQWCVVALTLLSLTSAAVSLPTVQTPAWAQMGAGISTLLIPASPAAAITVAAVTAAITATVWGMEIAAYRRLAAALGAVRLFWSVIPFMLWRPIGNLLFRINHRPMRKSHFTWQR